MELDQDLDTPDEPEVAPQEADDDTPSDVEPDQLEPDRVEPSRRDESLSERLRMVEAQSRIYQEEAERNRRELESARAGNGWRDPREEQARLDAMDPEQRITYIFEKQQRESQNQVALVEARTTSQIDQLKFEAQLDKTAGNLGWSAAQRAKYSGDVEQVYNSIAQRALNAGRPDWVISRGDLLRHKLGDELMTSGAKAVKAARDKGKANIAKQVAKMPSASSNVSGKPAGKTKAQESMDRMLQAGVLEM